MVQLIAEIQDTIVQVWQDLSDDPDEQPEHITRDNPFLIEYLE